MVESAAKERIVAALSAAAAPIDSRRVGRLEQELRTIGRGERSSPATNDLPITMRLAEPPEPCELVRSA